MDDQTRFTDMLNRSAALKQRVATELAGAVTGAVTACETSLRGGGTLFFCGNGGSASDSQHLATELVIRLRGAVERGSWPAIALTADTSALTACGNDYGFDHIFERPLRGLARAGDVLFGITTSGRSANVVRALQAAQEMGVVTIGFLGGEGAPARQHCDHPIIVPATQTGLIQECHIAIGHAMLELLEDRLVHSGFTLPRRNVP